MALFVFYVLLTYGALMHPDAFLVGKKIVLRPARAMDAKVLVQWMNNPKTREYLARVFPVSLPAEKDWVEKLSKLEKNPGDIVFIIETRADNKPVGIIGLHSINWFNRHATTGTVIGDDRSRNKGYATEAKMLILKYAFDNLGLHKIISRAYAKNLASIRYSEKCGYVQEGLLKSEMFRDGSFEDIVLMACFRETWLPVWEKYNK